MPAQQLTGLSWLAPVTGQLFGVAVEKQHLLARCQHLQSAHAAAAAELSAALAAAQNACQEATAGLRASSARVGEYLPLLGGRACLFPSALGLRPFYHAGPPCSVRGGKHEACECPCTCA